MTPLHRLPRWRRWQGETGVSVRSIDAPTGAGRLSFDCPRADESRSTARTQDEILERVDEARRGLDHALSVASARTTVGEFLAYWLDVTSRRGRRSTYEAYELTVRRVRPYLGRDQMSRLGPAKIQATYDRLSEAGTLSTQRGTGSRRAPPCPRPCLPPGPDHAQPLARGGAAAAGEARDDRLVAGAVRASAASAARATGSRTRREGVFTIPSAKGSE